MTNMRGKERRHFDIALDPELNHALDQYIVDMNLSNKPEAIRQILWERFAATPEIGARLAAQDRAFFQARREIMSRVAT